MIDDDKLMIVSLFFVSLSSQLLSPLSLSLFSDLSLVFVFLFLFLFLFLFN